MIKFVLVAMLLFPNGTYQLTYNDDLQFQTAENCRIYMEQNYDLVQMGLEVWMKNEHGEEHGIEIQRIGCAPEKEKSKETGIDA